MFKLNLNAETFSTATLETDKQHQEHYALPYHAEYENEVYYIDISYPATYAYDIMHNNINPALISVYIKRKRAYPIVIQNKSGTHPLCNDAYTIEIRRNPKDLPTRELYEEAFEIIDEFNACVHKWFPKDKCLDWDILALIKERRKFM